MLPSVAIIGRPNVGKSTLFNRLVGKKIALVDDQPGVTRDRREGDAQLFDLKFRIVDTAGYEDDDAATLPGRMRQQTEAALAGANVAMFVVDGRAGITPLDEEIARWLRASDKPVILVINKAEGKQADNTVLEAYALGLGEGITISAEHGEGMADLFQALLPHVDNAEEEHFDREAPDAPLQLAIVGRPNAGKSTLINKLLGENRLVTGPEAGITRDSIAIDWVWHDPNPSDPELAERRIRLIDTAGMRKRARVQEKLEKLSVADARRAIDFAEVVVLLLDATKGLEHQDLKIADHVIEEGRALIIAINKWDVAEHASSLFNGIKAALDEGLSQLKGVPVLAVSAATGKGLDQMLKRRLRSARQLEPPRVDRPAQPLVRRSRRRQSSTGPRRQADQAALCHAGAQAARRPLSSLATVTDQLPDSYRRYLLNGIRRDLGFGAVPVRMNFRSSKNPFAADKD
jgi:GTP-binding protein